MFQLLAVAAVGIDVFSISIFLVPALLIWQWLLFRPMNFNRRILIIVFALYLAAVYTVVGIPSIKTLALEPSFNWMPFMDIVNAPAAYLKNTALNILLFVPLGGFLPILWKEYRPFFKTVLFGLGMSFFIELTQIFTFRLTDIDDLITNTAGTAIGYCIAKYLCNNFFLPNLFFGKKTELTVVRADVDRRLELPLLFMTVLIVMFLIKPFISDLLWSLVLAD